METAIIPTQHVETLIYFIRGHKVMLDSELASLYKVTTGNLNKAVQRNKDRFPPEFMFRLTKQEFENLRAQFANPRSWGGRRKLPLVFTEHGVLMLSSVLKSKRAVQVNIQIMKTFVRLREMLATHKDLARKLDTLEQKYDAQFKVVFNSIRELMKPPEPRKKGKLGFGRE